jgi:hypothetical protein
MHRYKKQTVPNSGINDWHTASACRYSFFNIYPNDFCKAVAISNCLPLLTFIDDRLPAWILLEVYSAGKTYLSGSNVKKMFHALLVYRTVPVSIWYPALYRRQCCGFGLVFPIRIQIQGVKLSGSGFWSWSDLAVTQRWISTWKLYFMRVICHKTYRFYVGTVTTVPHKQFLFVNFGHFRAPEFGFGSAFPIRIRSRRAKSMWIHANPDPDPKHWSYVSCTVSSFSKLPKR